MIINKFNDLDQLNSYVMATMNDPFIIPINTAELVYMADNMGDFVTTFRSMQDEGTQVPNEGTLVLIDAVVNDEQKAILHQRAEQAQANLEDLRFVFPYSKTQFRKILHPHLLESTFKRFFEALKSNGTIEKTTGQYTIMRAKLFSDENIVSLINGTITAEQATSQINNAASFFNDVSLDVSFYQQRIEEMTAQIAQLEMEKAELQQQIVSRQLTSWY